jgi:tetratricopeptide (TPR) repeat protein
MAKQAWYKRLWIRIITFIIAILLLIAGALVWILSTEHLIQGDWSTILSVVFTVLGVILALLTWLFPFSPDQTEAPSLLLARELVRESASFRMGDTTAANFDYITEPIKYAYDTARQALYDASIRVGSKRGILILGIANAGKTRLAFEVLTLTLPNWKVLLWNAAYDRLSEVPAPTISHGSGLVVFIDDLQEYVPPESYGADGRGFISDNRIATLQAFLDRMQTTEHLVVVATCRLEDETRVGARLRWLFDQLKVIMLPSFRVEATDPESAQIIDLFQQHGATDLKDWDGTLGSLVLGLSKKRSQYEYLVQSHSPTVIVLRAMKLLSLARIPVHTHSRIQGVCTGVFGESTLQEGAKIWQESADQLTRFSFVTEVKDQATGKYALVIRKDTYFDKVITDYPTPDRPSQLDQHLEQLRKVFVGLNDYSALISLAYAQGELKQYEGTLAAFEQAIRLRPNLAFLYIGKGGALDELKRYEEALAALEQAIHLDPTDARAFIGKGYVLDELKRYEEALAAFEQAIRLDPNLTVAYNGEEESLRMLGRKGEA